MSGSPVPSCSSPLMREDEITAGLVGDAEHSVMPDDSDAVVVCRVPGTDAVITQTWLPSGRCLLRDLPEKLDLGKIPVIGLSPPPEVLERGPGDKTSVVLLQPGATYTVILGAMPLIRFEDGPDCADCRPRVQEAALWMLRKLDPPLRLVAFAGIGRCGKSSTCSGISRLEGEGKDIERFSVGHAEDPETDGANMVVLPNPHGPGYNILIDCEGSDNPLTHNLDHYRALVAVIFAAVSQVVHCCDGTVKESTIEDIAATVATREALISTGGGRSDGGEDDNRRYWPELALLLIADKFQFTQDKLERLLQAPDGQGQSNRAQARSAIRQNFDVVHMQTLPHMDKEGYDSAICRLRDDVFGRATELTNSGLSLNGAQVAETLVNICAEYEEAAKDKDSNLKVQPDSIYARVVDGHLLTVMKRHSENARGLLPKVEHYCEGLEEEGLLSQVDVYLEAFDKETNSILSDRKEDIRKDLRTDLQAAIQELLLMNETHREAENRRARDVMEALQAVFKRQLPAQPLTRVVLDDELCGFAQRQSEQLDTFCSQTSSYHCKQVVDEAHASLRTQLESLLDELKVANQALRGTVAQDIEDTVAGEEKRFRDCVPELTHYVNHADVIQPLEDRRDGAISMAVEAVEPIRAKGSWEEKSCDTSISELKVRLDNTCLQLVEQNEAFAREDAHRCRVIQERMLGDVVRIIAEASACPARVEGHRILRAEEHEELSGRILAFVSAYDGETKSFACGSAVAEQQKALSEALTSELKKLREQSLALRTEVVKATESAFDAENDAFREALPAVSRWLPPKEVEHFDTRAEHMSAFDTSLAPMQQRGEVEAELCKEERGRLSEEMDKSWTEFLEQISGEKDKDQKLAACAAKEVADDADVNLPKVPLQGELLDAEGLIKLDQSKEWLGSFNAKTEDVACRPVVEEERDRLLSNLNMRVKEIWKDNNEKEIVKKNIRQAMDECTNLFMDILPKLEHYEHGLAMRNPAAGVLEKFQTQIHVHSVKGDWEHRHCEVQQAELQSRFHASFTSLEQRNESFKSAEEIKCREFASELLDHFVRDKLPSLPLQSVVTMTQQEHISKAEAGALGEFDHRTEAASMRCHEVVGAGRSALKRDLQAQVEEVKRASSDRKERVLQSLQKLSNQQMHALDEVASFSEGEKKYSEAISGFKAQASQELWSGATSCPGEWEEEVFQSEIVKLESALQRALRRVKRRRWIPCGVVLAATAAALWTAQGVGGTGSRSLGSSEAWDALHSLLVQPELRETEPSILDGAHAVPPQQSSGPSEAATLKLMRALEEEADSAVDEPSEPSVLVETDFVLASEPGSSLEHGESVQIEPASSLAAQSHAERDASSAEQSNDYSTEREEQDIPDTTSDSKDAPWHQDDLSDVAEFEEDMLRGNLSEEGTDRKGADHEGVDPWYRAPGDWAVWLVSAGPVSLLMTFAGAGLASSS